ncbi:MAG TPA: hypothetical protein VFM37_09255 [Pseudonocardiaceae bacterium]|nr:hypothetical protein [Pseudonocardiaceae bacterium]
MIIVSVPPTALSAAHGTETVIMGSSGSREYRDVPVWLPMATNGGATDTADHVIGHPAGQDR